MAHLNLFLAGWRGYFRHGNSTTVFHDLDRFAGERLARFISASTGATGGTTACGSWPGTTTWG